MATLNALDPNRCLRGKVGGLVYSVQPSGATVVRTPGVRRVPFTAAEKRAQCRLKLGHAYVSQVMADPALRGEYEQQADSEKMRLCDAIMADYLTDPLLAGIDTSAYLGAVGDRLLIITGDDFKVTRVSVILRDENGHRIETGEAAPTTGCKAKVWSYRVTTGIIGPARVTVEAKAYDRPTHSDALSVVCHL